MLQQGEFTVMHRSEPKAEQSAPGSSLGRGPDLH